MLSSKPSAAKAPFGSGGRTEKIGDEPFEARRLGKGTSRGVTTRVQSGFGTQTASQNSNGPSARVRHHALVSHVPTLTCFQPHAFEVSLPLCSSAIDTRVIRTWLRKRDLGRAHMTPRNRPWASRWADGPLPNQHLPNQSVNGPRSEPAGCSPFNHAWTPPSHHRRCRQMLMCPRSASALASGSPRPRPCLVRSSLLPPPAATGEAAVPLAPLGGWPLATGLDQQTLALQKNPIKASHMATPTVLPALMALDASVCFAQQRAPLLLSVLPAHMQTRERLAWRLAHLHVPWQGPQG